MRPGEIPSGAHSQPDPSSGLKSNSADRSVIAGERGNPGLPFVCRVTAQRANGEARAFFNSTDAWHWLNEEFPVN